VGCEFSQRVTIAFRNKGHEAYSCDILPTEGDHPEWHFQEDVLMVLKREKFDLGIFFPPCTHLAVSGARWFPEKIKDGRQQAGIDFFMALVNAPIEKIAIENPIGIMSTRYRKPDQIVQPFQFGEAYSKSTCLWLKNLPLLKPTKLVEPKIILLNSKETRSGKSRYSYLSNLAHYGLKRSITPEGLATSMAVEWQISRDNK